MTMVRSTRLILLSFGTVLVAGCCPCNSTCEPDDSSGDARLHEVRANTYTHSLQAQPALDADSAGNLLVVWDSRRQELGTYGVFGQRFDAAGHPLGQELHINRTVRGMQTDPAVAFTSDDRAWVVWESSDQDGQAGAIVARRFGRAASGEFGPLSDEFLVNQTKAGHQSQPAIAVSGDDTLMVTWISDHSGSPVATGRLIAPDGQLRSGEFRLGDANAGRESAPVVARFADDRFVAAWARTDADNRPAGVYARVFNAAGIPVGDEFAINDPDRRMHIEPSIDADATGRFVATWLTWIEKDRSYAVVCRSFDRDGARSEVRTLASGPEWHSGAAVAVAPDGRFVVSYNVEMPLTDAERQVDRPGQTPTPSEIWAQRFSADGMAVGERFRVNQFNDGRQAQTIAATGRQALWTARDQLAFVWAGGTDASEKNGIALSLIAPRGREIPAPPAIARVPAELALSDFDIEPLIPPVFDPNFVPEPPDRNVFPRGSDFGFPGIQATGWTPPDPDIAAGPDHVVVVVNGRIAFYTHSGSQTFSQALHGGSGFWGAQGAGGFVFDPVALYDVHSQRFIVGAAEHAGGNQYFLIAVSDDSNPNGTWHKYRFDVTSYGGFIDFPNLGVDHQAIYLCADFFESPRGNWIFIIPKAPALVGDPITIDGIRTATNFRSLGNVKNYDPNSPVQYFATSFHGGDDVTIDAVHDPLGNPTRYTIDLPVPLFTGAPNAEQLGTSNRADTIDTRIKNGVYRNGSLWLVHTVGGDSTAHVRWYEVAMNGWPLSGGEPWLKQYGTFDFGTGEHNWMADINVDEHGSAVICFNRSSVNQYISVQRAIRSANDPLGTFQAPVTMQESTSPEQGSRWGDYAGVDEEPDNPGSFWTYNEYRTSSWRTWVGQVILPPVTVEPKIYLPHGLPDAIEPCTATDIDVVIEANDDTLVPGTAMLHYRYDDGAYVDVPLTPTTGDWYTATLPGACGAPDFYFSVESTNSGTISSPDTGGTHTITVNTIYGDFDLDCDIDLADMSVILANYGMMGGATYEDGDLSRDGNVDLVDLVVILSVYGTSCN